jgi:hypothetical protein
MARHIPHKTGKHSSCVKLATALHQNRQTESKTAAKCDPKLPIGCTLLLLLRAM